MSYLSSYATRNPSVRGAGVDEKLPLNLPDFDGGAYVRAAPATRAAHPPADRGLLEHDRALVRA
jgi:hypothetical protein